MKNKSDETKTWLMAGAGIALAGWLWNRFKNADSFSIPSNLNQATNSNTGIAGGIVKIASNIITAVKPVPVTTNSAPIASTAPVTQAQFVDVIGQFNNVIATVYSPPDPAKVANSTADVKFSEALKWLATKPQVLSSSGWVTASNVAIDTKDGFITLFTSEGNPVSRKPVSEKLWFPASGYVIF